MFTLDNLTMGDFTPGKLILTLGYFRPGNPTKVKLILGIDITLGNPILSMGNYPGEI